MADDKIKISVDDINSAQVDAKIKHQEALQRAQQHSQQQVPALVPLTAVEGGKGSSVWYNTIFYMATFGLLGGLLGWGLGEIAYQLGMHDLDCFLALLDKAQEI